MGHFFVKYKRPRLVRGFSINNFKLFSFHILISPIQDVNSLNTFKAISETHYLQQVIICFSQSTDWHTPDFEEQERFILGVDPTTGNRGRN